MLPTEEYARRLTIAQAQQNQPWTVLYSLGVREASGEGRHASAATVPHILGTHTVLHAIKSLGKIAAVYEARDHDAKPEPTGPLADLQSADRRDRVRVIRAMAADLMTAALRFANLEGFDLAEALVERVWEKNGADFGPIDRSDGGHPAGCVCRGCR